MKMVPIIFDRIWINSKLRRQIPQDPFSQCFKSIGLDNVHVNDAFVEETEALYPNIKGFG